MPLNFPSGPTSGATYTYGDKTWQWNGYAWDTVSPNFVNTLNGATGNLSITGSANQVTVSGLTSFAIGLTNNVQIASSLTISGGTAWHSLNDGAGSGLDADLVRGVAGQRFIENLQTGLLYGGLISVNAGNTGQVNISAGTGIIVNPGASLTAMPNPTISTVNWAGMTGVTLSGLTSSDETWFAIDSSGNLVQTNVAFTDAQYASQIPLGAALHLSRTFIQLVKTYPHVSYAQPDQFDPFIRAFGNLKLSGHEISANGANLTVNRSAGKAYAMGRNYKNDPNNPNIVTDTSAIPVTTIYHFYRNGSGAFTTTISGAIIPGSLDNGTGTLGTVTPAKFTIQRLFYLPDQPTLLGVYYGRQEYNSISDALANIPFEEFSESESTATQGIFCGWLIVKGSTTTLNDIADAKFINAGLFRNTANIGGGGLAIASIDDLNDVTTTTPTNNQVLRWNSGTAQWVNSDVSSLAVSSFNGLTGAVTGITSGGTNVFTGLNTFNAGISVTGVATFTDNVNFIGFTSGLEIVMDSPTITMGDVFGGGDQVKLIIDNNTVDIRAYGTLRQYGGEGIVTNSNLSGTTASFSGLVSSSAGFSGAGSNLTNIVKTFNGLSGAVSFAVPLASASVTGVASFNATRFTVSGAGAVDLAAAFQVTGDTVVAGNSITTTRSGNSVTVDNNGVRSVNGLTGAVVSIATTGSNTFTGLNRFNAGISASALTVSGGVTFSGDIAVNGGDITTTSATATVFNTTATNLSIGSAATTLTMGAASGVATIRNPTLNIGTTAGLNYIGTPQGESSNLYIQPFGTLYLAPTTNAPYIGSFTQIIINNTSGGLGEVFVDGGNLHLGTKTTNDEDYTAVDLVFEGASLNGNQTTLTVVDPTADRTIIFPDASGTVALTNGLVSSLSGSTYISVSGSTGAVTITNTGVQTFNGLTGAVTGVASIRGLTGAVGITNGTGIGLSVSGQTMTFSNTGVLSIDGGTGAVTNVARTNVNNEFTSAQTFNSNVLVSDSIITVYDSAVEHSIILSPSTDRIRFYDDGYGNSLDLYAGGNYNNQVIAFPQSNTTLAGLAVTQTFSGTNTFVALTNFASGISAAGGVTLAGTLQGTTAAFTGLVSSTVGFSGSGTNITGLVSSFNGLTGAVTGVSRVNGFTGGITFAASTGITFTASAGTITFSTTGGGGSKTYAVYTPLDNQPPSTGVGYATIDTRNSIMVLDFDAATDEHAVFVGIMPEAASLGSGLKIRINWMATSATSGTCRWGVQIERMNTDEDSDSFDTAATAGSTTNATSGIITTTEITITTIDSVAAGDPFRIKVYRDADGTSGTDDMTGDAELVSVEVRSAA